ncbi:MAG: hypothetical protein OXC38_07115 [Gammaproteobacteria bacterium]|nr:hypothetical protein [Gammaproteobacteria bacterium]
MQKVTSTEYEKNLDYFHTKAIKSPLSIIRNKGNALVILSAKEYERLICRDRQAFAIEELSDEEVEAILKAEAPEEAKQYDHELV